MPTDPSDRMTLRTVRRRPNPAYLKPKPDTSNTTPPPSSLNSSTTVYPPTSINVPGGSITPTNNIRPVRREQVTVGIRTVLGHKLVFQADADIYRLGTYNYIDWYNGIPNPTDVSGDSASTVRKADESILVVGTGLKLGVGSDILFKGDDALSSARLKGSGNKYNLPEIGENFTDAPSVSLNQNLSELEAWVVVSDTYDIFEYRLKHKPVRNKEYMMNFTPPVLVEYGSGLLPNTIAESSKNLKFTFNKLHVDKVTNQWGTYDINRANPSSGISRGKIDNNKHEPMYIDVQGDNNSIDVVTLNAPYTERRFGYDSWIESTSVIKVTGNNNYVRVEIHNTHSHLWRYSGNDGHRSLVSIEGYNNIVVVVVYGTLEIGFGDRYDNYGYWLASNDSRNLLIVQTADGSPLSSKVKWKNIENMNSAGTGPTTYFCKYDHNGEHNPFKSWL